MKRILNRNAFSYIITACWVLMVCMIIAALLPYLSAIQNIMAVRHDMKEVLDSYSVMGAVEIYDNVKQSETSFSTIDNEAFCELMNSFCNLTYDEASGCFYSRDEDGRERFRISTPRVDYYTDGILKLKASYTMWLPVSWAGINYAEIEVPVKIVSRYENKYD